MISQLASINPLAIRCLLAAIALGTFSCSPVLAGVAWQPNGVPACSQPGAQESPYVAAVGNGETVVAWADVRGIDYDIYAQRLDAAGNTMWTVGGIRVCGAAYDQQFPAVVADGVGGAMVVWQDGRLGDDGLDLYAQRLSVTGVPQWAADGVPVCSHPAGMTDPPMAFSHAVTTAPGGFIVAWRDTRSDPIAGNTEIYAQKVGLAGTPLWTLNGVRLLGFSTVKWSTRNPVITPDDSGGAVVVWQDARTSATTGNDLYAQRVTSAGVAAWANNGVAVCSAPGDQGYPDLMNLGGGETAIVWEDKRSGNYDVYAQRLSGSGTEQWGANGRLLCNAANDQRTPRVVASGQDMVIAWTDKRASSVYTDIYAQKLDHYGNTSWQSNGSAICIAPGSQTRIRMTSAPSGYTLLAWMDTRNEATIALYDVYGQMIDSSATCRWESVGIPIAAITGCNQRLQMAAGDGAGGMSVVWEDDRNADWDIFAQRLTPWLPVGGIAEAQARPTGEPIALPARVVTGSFDGFFYVEESTRASGIRIEHPQSPAIGSLAAVSGTLGRSPEPFIQASTVAVLGPSSVPEPLGITASRMGLTPIGSVGALTGIGLLVRTWGTVVATATPEQPYAVISDGVATVRLITDAALQAGDTVVAAGVGSLAASPQGPVAAILTRTTSDVRTVSQ